MFNFEWLIKGYKYGFLQPLGKFRSAYVQQSTNVLLYAVTPDSERLAIAEIRDIYVPDDQELVHAVEVYRKRGWLQQMEEDVQRVGGDTGQLDDQDASHIINVRFKPGNVLVYDPRPCIAKGHKIFKMRRYQPLDQDVNDQPFSQQASGLSTDDPRRPECERTRAAQEGVTYDPRHVRMQNRLYDQLKAQYGPTRVNYEQSWVDLSVKVGDEVVFYELKLESTAKRSIRMAIGQLLEYAHYPRGVRAQRFVIVGDAYPTNDDQEYLGWIRHRYNIPVNYARFDWETNALEYLLSGGPSWS